MSRSGYSYDYEYMDLYRASVERALKGKQGQAFLRELVDALDSLPNKSLIIGELVNESGDFCSLGAICRARHLDVVALDYFPGSISKVLGIAYAMAAEIMYMNDEWERHNETPAQRWERMRKWATDNIIGIS